MGIPWKKIGLGVGAAVGGVVAGGAALKIASVIKGGKGKKPGAGASISSIISGGPAARGVYPRMPGVTRRKKKRKSLVITENTMQTINLLNRLARGRGKGKVAFGQKRKRRKTYGW